eukprot:TRINITY_DN727_c0_g1_i5.p1 TRINITY_DN727_c0_g1~~TRINITY_DN727_c0_g1_i5.p1  ORF type:complete len:852 (+),score=132.45 TRINITY_DN727_c0_g1_i5:92-2647(+)
MSSPPYHRHHHDDAAILTSSPVGHHSTTGTTQDFDDGDHLLLSNIVAPLRPKRVVRNIKEAISAPRKVASVVLSYFPLLSMAFPSFYKYPPQHTFVEALKGDIIAGITVGVMMVPQGLAYALLAGLPPIYGLYAGLLPPFIYGIMGSSSQLSVGPVAVVSILVAEGLNGIDPDNFWTMDERIGYAMGLSMIVGAITFLFGVLKLGFIETVLSHPVTSGYLTAVAFIIAASQLGSLFGIAGLAAHGSPYTTFYHAFEKAHEGQGNLGSTIMAVIAITIMMSMKLFKIWIGKGKKPWTKTTVGRVLRLFPDMLVVILFSIIITWKADLNHTHKIAILGDIPSGLPIPSFPETSITGLASMISLGASIALVGFVESMSVAKAMASRHGTRLDPNQELVSLGLANVIGSIFLAFATSASPPRSAVNELAGAKSGFASVITSFFVGLALVLFAPLGIFFYLPKPVMASVIVVALYDLVDFEEPRFLWRISHRVDLIQLSVTFLLTTILGAGPGVLIIVVISVAFILKQSSTLQTDVYGGNVEYVDLSASGNMLSAPPSEARPANVPENVRVVTVLSALFFANAAALRDVMVDVQRQYLVDCGAPADGRNADQHPRLGLILDLSKLITIDSTAIHVLKELEGYLMVRHTDFHIVCCHGKTAGMISRSQWGHKGVSRMFPTLVDAVNYCREQLSGGGGASSSSSSTITTTTSPSSSQPSSDGGRGMTGRFTAPTSSSSSSTINTTTFTSAPTMTTPPSSSTSLYGVGVGVGVGVGKGTTTTTAPPLGPHPDEEEYGLPASPVGEARANHFLYGGAAHDDDDDEHVTRASGEFDDEDLGPRDGHEHDDDDDENVILRRV